VANQNIFAGAETTTGANTECVLAPNHTMGNGAILPHHCFPAPVIKPSATNVANSRVIGTAISPSPSVMVPAHTALPADLSVKVCMSHVLLHRSACKLTITKKKNLYSEELDFKRLFLKSETGFSLKP
jgi:hypothetical protein